MFNANPRFKFTVKINTKQKEDYTLFVQNNHSFAVGKCTYQ